MERTSTQTYHKSKTHILWKTINNLQNKKPAQDKNRTITFKNNIYIQPKEIATQFNKQFTNTNNYSTNKNNRKTNRKIDKLTKTPINITETQVKHAIQESKINKSTGPDNINIQHLKHLGNTAITYLTKMYNIALNNNIIPHTWKLGKIIPIAKPNKNYNESTSYRPISLLSPIAKTLEKIILPHIDTNKENTTFQHGFKSNHSTITALQEITNTITTGFNKKQPPDRTILLIALDMSKAFDTVDTHKLIDKINNTNTQPTIIKYIANYIKGRQAYTLYNNHTSNQARLKTGVPQGSAISPTLFNIYTADIPKPPPKVHLTTYADDKNTYSSDKDIHTIEQRIQPYLNDIHTWTINNNLQLNPDKSTATLFTPDPAEYNTQINLQINNNTIPTIKNPKILGITFDPKLTFAEHIKKTLSKASKTTNIIKALTSTTWGKQKETLTNTYKTITRPILEYGSTVWSPIISDTNINKLQTIQNTALRIATGCTSDTNTQHLHQETKILPG